MRKVSLLIIILLLAASLTACKSQSGDGSKDRGGTIVKKGERAKSAKPTSRDKRILKDALLPAIDVISQVRDAAVGVTTGYTPPDLAVAIINGADGFLTQTRLMLNQARVSSAATAKKTEATDLVRSVSDRLEKLTAAVKTKDKARIEEIVGTIDSDIGSLRKVVGVDAPAGKPRK